jgi:hypothetical protein
VEASRLSPTGIGAFTSGSMILASTGKSEMTEEMDAVTRQFEMRKRLD